MSPPSIYSTPEGSSPSFTDEEDPSPAILSILPYAACKDEAQLRLKPKCVSPSLLWLHWPCHPPSPQRWTPSQPCDPNTKWGHVEGLGLLFLPSLWLLPSFYPIKKSNSLSNLWALNSSWGNTCQTYLSSHSYVSLVSSFVNLKGLTRLATRESWASRNILSKPSPQRGCHWHQRLVPTNVPWRGRGSHITPPADPEMSFPPLSASNSHHLGLGLIISTVLSRSIQLGKKNGDGQSGPGREDSLCKGPVVGDKMACSGLFKLFTLPQGLCTSYFLSSPSLVEQHGNNRNMVYNEHVFTIAGRYWKIWKKRCVMW